MTDSSSQTVEETKQQTTIETPRLILRAAIPPDAIPLYEAFSDAEVMRYWYASDSAINMNLPPLSSPRALFFESSNNYPPPSANLVLTGPHLPIQPSNRLKPG